MTLKIIYKYLEKRVAEDTNTIPFNFLIILILYSLLEFKFNL